MVNLPPVEPGRFRLGMFLYTDRSGTEQKLYFQFNPETLKRSRSATFNAEETKTGHAAPLKKGTPGRAYSLAVDRWKIDFDLRIDATAPLPREDKLEEAPKNIKPRVMQAIKQLEALLEPNSQRDKYTNKFGYEEIDEPPPVSFCWGERVWQGHVTSLAIQETRFSPELEPLRAEVNISMIVTMPESSQQRGGTGGQSA